MYLKNIQVKGFKSFAGADMIETGPGITCIVGPNGCGKSNISDAVRWVLGEQNARTLRGDKMADLIFGGTERRPAEGMAEVSLLLDNSDNYFPSDYTELQVTRRIYGSGETEYLINENKVRLKDVAELFMDTGIGTQTYSIIEQGRVESILRARPVERRRIIEEAAGVVKYQTRKEECLRKLKRTEDDLVRLYDILQEKERQVKYLKNQASRAQRFEEHSRRLRELDLIHIARRYVMLEEEADRFRQRLAEAEARRNDAGTKHREAEARLEEAYLAEERAESALRTQQESVLVLSSEIKNIEEKAAIYRDRERDTRAQANRQREEMSATGNRVEEDRRRREETSARMQALRQREAEAKTGVEETRQRLEKAQAEYSQRQRALAGARDAALAADRAHGQIRGQLHELEREMERTQQQRARMSAELERIAAEQQGLAQRLSEMQSEREGLYLRQARLDEEITELRGISDQLSGEVSAADGIRARIEEDFRMKKVRLASLSELHENLEGLREGTKRLLRRKGQPDCPFTGILGALADHITVKRGYEAALEAALGEALQHVLVQEGEEAIRILDEVIENRTGRVSVVALDLAGRAADDDSVPAELAALGAIPARELVEIESPYDALGSLLLGRTLVVEDHKSLSGQMEKIARGWRIATRRGMIVDGRGVLTGGKGEGAGILERRGEMIELEKASGELERQLNDQKAAVAELQRRRDEASERMAALVAERHQLEIELASAGQQLGGLERDHRRLSESSEKMQGEINQLDAAARKLAEEHASRQGEVGQREEEYTGRQAAQSEAERAFVLANQARDALNQEFSAARFSLVEITKDREQAERDYARLGREIEELEGGLTRKEQEQIALGERIGQMTAALEEMETRRKELWTQKESAESVLKEHQEAVAAKKAGREAAHAEVRRLDQLKNALQEECFNHQRDFDQRHYEEETLRHRLEEDYQRAIEEVVGDFGEDERSPDQLAEEVAELRGKIERLGVINQAAIEDYARESEQLAFMTAQVQDLESARGSLMRTISDIKKTTEQIFMDTFNQVKENFHHMFRRLFNGGRADLVLIAPPVRIKKQETPAEGAPPQEEPQEGEVAPGDNGKPEDDLDVMEAGIEILVQPPGKNLHSISLMSGGERCLTAIALLFGLYMIKPSPFCFLDEIDGPLDDVNIQRFGVLLQQFVPRTQFIIITHNKRTMEMADRIYGVTMEERGVSTLISMHFDSNRRTQRETQLIEQMESERTAAE